MMFTTNKVFLDSSIFIETSKKNHVPFFTFLTQADSVECCINEIVCSEVWYLSLGLFGGASPLSIREKAAVRKVMSNNTDTFSFFKGYLFLNSELSTINIAYQLMETYNLLPNDALILATCKQSNIKFLASHDKDFDAPCVGEGITLVTAENYQAIFSTNQ